MNSEIANWLMTGPAWIQYRIQLDLLGMDPDSETVRLSRAAILADPKIQSLINGCAGWDNPILKRHNDALHPLHKLSFLADLGLNRDDPGMKKSSQ